MQIHSKIPGITLSVYFPESLCERGFGYLFQ